jgi:hypothetical protein
MLFRTQQSEVLAISQPAHAWVSGQMLRAWDDELTEPLLLAAEQHDIGWLDWETDPSFDPNTGRPHLFRDVGASTHAPMWMKGTMRAFHAWGAHVALLISRHGGVIYRRYIDRHRLSEADARAAQNFLETQAPLEAAWARSVGLDADGQRRGTTLLAAVDTLSLAVCGELKTPLTLEAVDRRGERIEMQIAAKPGSPFEFLLSPWPFRRDSLVVEGEARALPAEGRFADEAAMRAWLASDERTGFRSRLIRG